MKHLLPLSLFGSWFASPAEITVFTIISLTLIAIVVFSYFFYKNKQRKDHKNLMLKKYESYLNKLSLNDEELNFVNKLTKYLSNEELRYHMLTNKRSFYTSVDELKKREKIPRAIQESVEGKLNFPVKKVSRNYFTSEDLPTGMPALVLLTKENKISALISDNTPSSLSLKLSKKTDLLKEAAPLNIYFHDDEKIFTINTTVLSHKENILQVPHSLLQSQKRRVFKRKRIKLPLMIKHSDYEETPKNSYIIDISEGGASLENPDLCFRKNERITLYYHIDTDNGFQIRGEVLRLTAKGRIIHIKFFDRDLTIRSRIKTIVT